MTYQDWRAYFNKIYICKQFSDKWSAFSVDGVWQQGIDMSCSVIEEQSNQKARVKHDSNKTWFLNEQYRFTVQSKTELFVSLT